MVNQKARVSRYITTAVESPVDGNVVAVGVVVGAVVGVVVGAVVGAVFAAFSICPFLFPVLLASPGLANQPE